MSPHDQSRRRRFAFPSLAIVAFLLTALTAIARDVPANATPNDRFEPAIAAFEASDARARPAPGGVLFIGSSSFRLWATMARDFPGVPVINRGFGGSRLADATRYADRIVLPYRPGVIVLYAGDNDLNDGIAPAAIAADFDAFVARVRGALPDVAIVFVSLKPSPSRAALLSKQRETNALIRARIERLPRAVYVDIVTPMLDAQMQQRPELFLEDRLHMNAAGYAIWRERIAAALVTLQGPTAR